MSAEESIQFVLSVFDGPEDIVEAESHDRTPAAMLRRNAASLLLADGEFNQDRAGTVRVLIDHSVSLDASGSTWSDVRARLARLGFRLVAPSALDVIRTG